MPKFTKYNAFEPDKHFIELANGTRAIDVALKGGDVDITIVELARTPVIPSYPQDIFSFQAATERVPV